MNGRRFAGVFVASLFATASFAEGSRELSQNGGGRPHKARGSTIKVYAEAGETIYLGSSTVGLGNGVINYTEPDGTTGSCGTSGGGNGRIFNRAQELAGPAPNPGGYDACVRPVAAGQQGVWIIDLVPRRTSGSPSAISASANWTQGNNSTIAAWDATVRDAGGNEIPGRTYVNLYNGNMGSFSGANARLFAVFNVLTNDGYQYEVNSNGLLPFAFSFFANNTGIRDAAGNPTYLSAPRTAVSRGTAPTDEIYDPEAADAANAVTHKMFINPPDPNMPAVAAIAVGGSTWLYNEPATADVTNVSFVGFEGTVGQAGTAPLGGNFLLDSNVAGSLRLLIDLNQNGINDGNDRLLIAPIAVGSNQIPWDGLDGNGVPLPASGVAISLNVDVDLQLGEVHFPLDDAEASDGMILTRLNGFGAPDTVIYYNDDVPGIPNNPAGTGPVPISCSQLPVSGNPTPDQACPGIDSAGGGAHTWGPAAGNGFGDRVWLDTWTFIQPQFSFPLAITLAEADLNITKTHSPATLIVGAPFSYQIVAGNDGPDDVSGAQVSDAIPAELGSLSLTGCVPSGGATCVAQSLVGNDFSAMVDLPNGATATYTISGVVNTLPAGGVLTNRAAILRTADVTDPDATDVDTAPPTDPVAECAAIDPGLVCNNIADDVATVLELDLGDAPDSYGTLLASDGARHSVSANVLLGATLDSDIDGFGDGLEDDPGGASDDDTENAIPDDEDVISGPGDLPLLLTSDASYTIAGLSLVNTSGGNAYLAGWIDLNQNGVFDSSEISAVTTVANGATTADLNWPLISGQLAGDTYIRFRFSSDPNLLSMPLPTGYLTDGEVEDHIITVSAAIEVIKQTLPDGAASLFDISIDGSTPFTVGDNQSTGFVNVAPGTVTISETAVGAVGNIDPTIAVLYGCVDGFGSSVAGGSTTLTTDGGGGITLASFDVTVPATASVSSGAEQTFSCTIYNVESAEVTFIKQATPADATDFAFVVTEPATVMTDFDFSLDGETADSDADLQINELDVAFDVDTSPTPVTLDYTITETVPTNWELTDIACIDIDGALSAAVDVAAGEVTIGIDPGDKGLCTITNRALGTIIVDKVTTPAGDPTSFSFTSNFAGGFSLADGDTAVQTDNLSAGLYSVTEAPLAGWVQVSATCDDGSDPASISLQPGETVTCTFVNQATAPLANSDTSTGNATGTSVTVDVLANDSDPENNIDPTSVMLIDPISSLPVGSVVVPGEGVWSVNMATGEITFDPCTAAGVPDPSCTGLFSGDPMVIDYVVSDTTGFTSPPAGLTVDYDQFPPVANDESVFVGEDSSPTTIDVLNGPGADTDPNGDIDPTTVNTTCAACSPPANGTLVNNGDGTFSYEPAPGYSGPDSFTYEVCDTTGLCDTATVMITVSDQGTPLANPDVNSTDENQPVMGSVFGNDDLTDDAMLDSFDAMSANGGTVSMDTSGNYTYTPAVGFSGTDTFEYTICDDDTPTPECSTTSVTITVVDEGAPTVMPDSNSTTEDQPVSGGVFGNDMLIDDATLDSFDAMSAAGGTVAMDAMGNYTYTPAPGFAGTDTFDYTVCDDDLPTPQCATTTVTITVADEGMPATMPDSNSTTEDQPVSGAVFANDTLIDDAMLDSFDAMSANGGTVTMDAMGNYTYTPAAGFVGTDTFTYTVCDDDSPMPQCATETVTITVGDEGAPVAMDDVNSTTEDQLVSGGAFGNDSLIDGATLNSFDAMSANGGTVTMDAAGNYTYTPPAGFAGTDTFTYTVCDDDAPTAQCSTATVTITVADEGAPTTTDDTNSTNEDQPVNGSVFGNDSLLDGATLDSFDAISVGGGTVTMDASGNYTYTPAPGFSGSDTFTYTVCDDDQPTPQCSTSTVTITVVDMGTPAAADDNASTPSDTPVSIDVLSNDTLNDGADLDSFDSTSVNGGTISQDPISGELVYTPAPGFEGDDTFTYTICDDDTPPTCATATVTVTVAGATPIANPDVATAGPDETVTIDVLGNDTDANNDLDPASVQLIDPVSGLPVAAPVTIPGEGTYSVNPDGTIAFDPDPAFEGTSTISYQVADDDGNVSNPTDLSVTVAGAPPVALDDNAITPPDTPVTVAVLANDNDANGDLVPTSVMLIDPASMSPVTSVTVPGEGSYSVNADGSITFTPEPGFQGAATPIEYTVEDDDGNSDSALLNVFVQGADPVAVDDSASTPVNTPVTIGLLDNDLDSNGDIDPASVRLIDPLSGLPVTSVSVPGQGTFVVNPDGSATFTPEPGFSGEVTPLTYSVSDLTGNTASAMVAVSVTPEAAPDSATTPADTPVSIPVLANDSGSLDPGSVSVASGPFNGTATVDSDPASPTFGQVVYAPAPGFSGTDTFTYTALDSAGNAVTETVTVTVTPMAMPDTVMAVFDAPTTFNVNTLLGNDSGDLDPATFSVLGQPANGSVSFDPVSGDLVYTPNPGFTGVDTFDYEVCDQAGQCSTATVSVAIPPAALPDQATTPFEQAVTVDVLANDIPLSTFDPASVTITMPATNGVPTVNADGSISYQPNPGFSGVDTFEYEVCDPAAPSDCKTALVTITVLPEATDDSANATAGVPATIDVLANDGGDLDPATVAISSPPSNGSVTVNPDGTLTYTPNPGFVGTDTFFYEVCDTSGNCTTASVTVAVAPLPVATDDTQSGLTPGQPASIDPLINDTDTDGTLDPTTVVLVNPPAGATLSPDGRTLTVPGEGVWTVDPVTGVITFTPEPGYAGSPTPIQYTVDDNDGNTTPPATITLLFSAGAPVATNDSAVTNVGVPVEIPVTLNDSDPDGDLDDESVLLIDPVSGAQVTSVTIDGQGTFVVTCSTCIVTFTPDLAFGGRVDPIDYVIFDSVGQSDQATISVTVLVSGPLVIPTLDQWALLVLLLALAGLALRSPQLAQRPN